MSLWVVIPLKDFIRAKGRLAGVLSASERHILFQAMVEDILQVLQKVQSVSGILLVSDDPTAAVLAEQYQVELIPENKEERGLNPAVTQAAKWLESRNISAAMVLHGDLPLVNEKDLEDLVQAHLQQSAPAVTIVGDSHQQGSNCLLCSPPNVIRFCYGEGSFSKHKAEAVAGGVHWQQLVFPSLALDVDEPNDLCRLLNELESNPDYRNGKTYSVLFDGDLASRVRAMVDGLN